MKRAIIIVDHGSIRSAANDMLEDLAALLRSETSDHVYTAHMELAKPTLEEAFAAAARDGAEFIFVFPYFLAPGRHSREDIPRLCKTAATIYPGIRWHCSGPIGLDRIMVDLILERVRESEKSSS
jgi:sirohydrochlorin ferrochelatase